MIKQENIFQNYFLFSIIKNIKYGIFRKHFLIVLTYFLLIVVKIIIQI